MWRTLSESPNFVCGAVGLSGRSADAIGGGGVAVALGGGVGCPAGGGRGAGAPWGVCVGVC